MVGDILHATRDWVKTELANLVGSAPEKLNTLDELAKALNNDENFANIVLNNMGFLEKYDTTNVHILKEGIDIVVENNKIVDTISGETLDFGDKTVIVPEGIIEITSNNYNILFQAKSLFLPTSCTMISNNAISQLESIILDEGMTQFNTSDVTLYGNLYLPSTLTNLSLYDTNCNIYCHENGTRIDISSMQLSGALYCPFNIKNITVGHNGSNSGINVYCHNPEAQLSTWGNLNNTVLLGYGGSTAEKAAYDNGCTFKNIGSICTPFLNSSTSEVGRIKPNEYYSFTSIPSLIVILESAATDKLDEFMFSFETPANISAFSFEVLTDEDVEIKWIKEPNLKPNYIYEVSVVNGVGVIAGTAKEVT